MIHKATLENMPIKELSLHDDSAEPLPVDSENRMESTLSTVPVMEDQKELEATLRQEAFGWSRLIFPPLKPSGHVILDGCTAEGTEKKNSDSSNVSHFDRQNYAHDYTEVSRQTAIL